MSLETPSPLRTHETVDTGNNVGDTTTTPDARAKELGEAKEKFGTFFADLEKTINGYLGTKEILFTVKPGGWYIDLENLQINADPEFFLEKGYTSQEALYATFHEARHFLDMLRDPEAYDDQFNRFKTLAEVHPSYPKALHRLYNCLDDVLINNGVDATWKAGDEVRRTLYPKLFPGTDLRGNSEQKTPRHRQFMYALLRRAMLPDEEIEIDDEVREAIERIERDPRKPLTKLLTMVDRTGAGAFEPASRYALVMKNYEPTFLEFFKKDLEDRQSLKEDEQGGGGGGNGDGDPFDDDQFKDAIPDPIDYDDLLEQAKKINDKIQEQKKNEFKEAMGVNRKDYEAYARDYRKIEQYIKELSSLFDEVISKRKHVYRKMRKQAREGLALDPRKLATAVAEVRTGNLEPVVMLDYKKYERVENRPTEIDFTLVCDGSGSMNERYIEQRRIAVLVLEAFADFRARIEKARRTGEDIRLDVRTALRIFSDKDYQIKQLGDTLTHEERVRAHKALTNLPFGDNNEIATFNAIEGDEFTLEKVKKMKEGNLKKIILFLTDGESDKEKIKKRISQLYDLAGGTPDKQDALVIAAIGFDGGDTAKETYAPHGYYAQHIGDVPREFEKFLKAILDNV